MTFMALLCNTTAFSQYPLVTDVTVLDVGSGTYRFLPAAFADLGVYNYTGTTWYHNDIGSQTTNDQAVFYGVPGFYTVYFASSFDDPQTSNDNDYTYYSSYYFEITCVPVYEEYPTVVTDIVNEEWIVTPLATGGTAPFIYTWSVDADYTINPDGTISVPFGENGYFGGDVTVTDANGCFTWPHSFGGQNPNAECSLELITANQGNQVELTIHFMFGNDPVYYPDASIIDFGDGTQMYWYEDAGQDGIFQHTYAESGVYQICATMIPEDISLCALTGCTEVEVIVSNTETELRTNNLPSLALYPNPSSGKFVAETNGCDALVIYNLIGEQILYMQITGPRTALDMPLAAGVYMIQSRNKGITLSTQKLIVR